YMMIHQQDPVGLITFGDRIKNFLPARSKRGQLGNILAMLANSHPSGTTEVGKNIQQIASMVKHRSLLMIFSDLLTDQKNVLDSLQRLRYAGHDVILFHILDEAEVYFPFEGMVDLKEPEGGDSLILDAEGMKADYLEAVEELRETYREKLFSMGVDYVPLDTSMPFDKALIEYLSQRKARF
ncbi:MAG: DUF58 domain-containing protein, partial [Planctomycetaceae bacterium]|nr:DUF58 domain-containing protein [Planctomycetaceae bacterium]